MSGAMTKPRSIEERLFAKVTKTDGCWIWTASKDKKGYGRLMVKEGDRHVPRLAHRLSYLCLVGPIPDGQFVCHRCDNPACVNPAHLWLGSNRDNAYDMISKGRWKQPPVLPGERNPCSKLTREAVEEIRSVVGNTKALAEKYGVSITAVKRARNGQGWKSA